MWSGRLLSLQHSLVRCHDKACSVSLRDGRFSAFEV